MSLTREKNGGFRMGSPFNEFQSKFFEHFDVHSTYCMYHVSTLYTSKSYDRVYVKVYRYNVLLDIN